jgi:peptidoglycan/xylan/chitin deacetylase (PgdA/CDA1 family)
MSQLLLSLALAGLSPVLHGPRSEPAVALTFDACPTSRTDGYDEAVVQVLIDHQVPATVFLAGKWVEHHQAEARLLGQHFELGNHGYAHNDALQPHLSYADASRDIERAQRTIRKATGQKPRYYRPPGELYNDEVLRAARDHGLTTILHDVASGDPDPNLKPDRIVRYVTWKTKPGSIVIFHINGRGWTTAKTLPTIIENLTAKGMRFVTVGELLKAPRAKEGP